MVAQLNEVVEGGTSLFGIRNTPHGEECGLLASSHHGKASALADKPRVMVGKAHGVSVLAGSDKGHVMIFDQVAKELAKELGEPPHADEVTA